MRIYFRIAAFRRQVAQLTALAERRATQTASPCAAPSFRALAEAEAEAILGEEVLSALAGGRRRA